MEEELSNRLSSNGVPEAVIQWMTAHCKDTKLFANYVDAASEVQAHILDHIEAHKADRTALAALKLWKKHSRSSTTGT